MENFRSKSYRDGCSRMQMESYYGGGGGGGSRVGPNNTNDLRSYSTNSYQSSSSSTVEVNKEVKMKKGKGGGGGNSGTVNSSSTKNWSLNDPELQRMKRVASYKVYTVEGKMKGSLRKSFKWIKNTCSHVVHGEWR